MTMRLVTPPEVEGEVRRAASLLATSSRDELAAAIQDLRDRDVTTPDEFASLEASVIADTVRWYDHERTQRPITAGVLVTQLRAGGKPGWKPARAAAGLEHEAQYAADVVAWLRKHFPELDRPRFGPHPAAVAEVIRLHARDGNGVLTKAVHGREIRAAVVAWNTRWGAE